MINDLGEGKGMKKKVKILMKGFSEKEKKELENIEIEIVIRKRAKPNDSDWIVKGIVITDSEEDTPVSIIRKSGTTTASYYTNDKLFKKKQRKYRNIDAKLAYIRRKGRKRVMRRHLRPVGRAYKRKFSESVKKSVR